MQIGIVIPCYNEEAVMPALKTAMEALFAQILAKNLTYECLLVDDGSSDCTYPAIVQWHAENPCVRGIHLSRNFGHQAALTCAYENINADAVVSIDADLQDPPEVILEMIDKFQAGADIVLAVRKSREGETIFKRATAALYYRMLHAFGMKYVQRDCGDFRLLSRKALSALNGMPEHFRMLRAMIGWIGFKTERVEFIRHARVAGETKYPFMKMLALAMDGIISFSVVPLRLCYLFAGVIFLIMFAYWGYVWIGHFYFDKPLVEGWSSLMIAITLFGSFNLFCLGIIGEYIGRIYGEVKHRPVYLIGSQTSDHKQ